MGQSHRSGRKPGFTAQKVTEDSLILLHHAIAHDADHTVPIETFFHVEHRLRPANLDDRLSHSGIQLLNQATNQGCVLLVHQDTDFEGLSCQTHRTYGFKASEVRAQEKAPPALGQQAVEIVQTMHRYCKLIELTAQEIHAVK